MTIWGESQALPPWEFWRAVWLISLEKMVCLYCVRNKLWTQMSPFSGGKSKNIN